MRERRESDGDTISFPVVKDDPCLSPACYLARPHQRVPGHAATLLVGISTEQIAKHRPGRVTLEKVEYIGSAKVLDGVYTQNHPRVFEGFVPDPMRATP